MIQTAVNSQIGNAIAEFKGKPDDITIRQTGQQEEQQETLSFLVIALIMALE